MDAIANGSELVIRATRAGTWSTTLSNGRTVKSSVADVPAALDLTGITWHIAAEDWQPANPYAATTGPAAAETKKTKLELDIQGLKPWPQIPALQFVAGLATYTATFDLPVTWAKGQGALLSLGEVFDTFSVTVNHQPVSVDQLSAEADLGAQLKPGRNTINVRVATTLNNRLASLDEDVKNRGFVQPYGLVGPVRITPYRTVPVSGR